MRACRLIGIGVAAASIYSMAEAQTFPVQFDGKITKLWADTSDTILELDQPGPCGTIYFRIQRSATNFQEMTALMLTAAASARTVRLQLSGCSGSDNIVSHGAAFFGE